MQASSSYLPDLHGHFVGIPQPLSKLALGRLSELSQWHDTALNWDYPPDPGPWSAEEYAKFEREALTLLTELQAELGPKFEVVYEAN